MLGVTQGTVSNIVTNKSRRSTLLPLVAEKLAVNLGWLLGETDQMIDMLDASGNEITEEDLALIRAGKSSRKLSNPDQLKAPAQEKPNGDDRVLEIPVIDLAYGMGGTYLDDVDANVRSEPFPLSFIRRYTKAKAEDLVIADGLGDSMAPTIGSNDQMLIDRSVDTLRVADQIWAFSFGGVGMVKRLRPRPDGSIAILSDNPAVPEDRAVDDELFLIGRVVAIVRKV